MNPEYRRQEIPRLFNCLCLVLPDDKFAIPLPLPSLYDPPMNRLHNWRSHCSSMSPFSDCDDFKGGPLPRQLSWSLAPCHVGFYLKHCGLRVALLLHFSLLLCCDPSHFSNGFEAFEVAFHLNSS
jgi:hypothetical protein